MNSFSIVRHFRHARACSQCYQCGGRQSKEVFEQENIFLCQNVKLKSCPSSGPGGSGGAVRQRKGASGGETSSSSTPIFFLVVKVMKSYSVSHISSIYVEKLARLDEDPNC